MEIDLSTPGGRAIVHTLSTFGDVTPLVDTSAEVVGDSVVRISVALHNAGPLRLYEPAAIAAPSEQFRITSIGPGLRTPFWDKGPRVGEGGEKIVFDSLLPLTAINPKGRRYIAAGSNSRPVVVIISLPHGVTRIRISLQASALRVYTIGSTAPLSETESVIASDNATIYTHGEFGKFRVVKDRIWLVFVRSATLDQRQAALEAIDGTVIGGSSIGAGSNYYVQLPQSGDAQSLIATIHKLETLTGVRAATINNLTPPSPA